MTLFFLAGGTVLAALDAIRPCGEDGISPGRRSIEADRLRTGKLADLDLHPQITAGPVPL